MSFKRVYPRARVRNHELMPLSLMTYSQACEGDSDVRRTRLMACSHTTRTRELIV